MPERANEGAGRLMSRVFLIPTGPFYFQKDP